MKTKPKVVCLMGPTASGKTQLAVALHQQFASDIISVDSVMVYRGMDIGTAKPSATLLAQAPHQLIDVRDPTQPYCVANFCQDAQTFIQASLAAQRIPLLVGGSMLYFHALQTGLADMSAADTNVRRQLEHQANEQGWAALYTQLTQVDPVAAANINPNDRQRIQRALEIYHVTGKPMSQHWQQPLPPADYEFINLALIASDRAILHQRIEQRVQQMLADGLIAEVNGLFERGDLDLALPALRSVGYRQVWLYLQGAYDVQTMQDKITAATRQLAKRQLTWLRRWPNLQIIDALLPLSERLAAVKKILYRLSVI
ncbi:MAG: tRNA (adenosine(37)-N6)-dimethylallyltransferase MiaA [Legionellales bacterium]|nr:tRNA (adenosine(37)-N6)-dimethylallyltransferase MiaA [Legionellales bacterium]